MRGVNNPFRDPAVVRPIMDELRKLGVPEVKTQARPAVEPASIPLAIHLLRKHALRKLTTGSHPCPGCTKPISRNKGLCFTCEARMKSAAA